MPAKALSSADLHRMLASGAQLAAESARCDAENLRGVVNCQGAEIANLKAQLSMLEAARAADARKKAADALRMDAKRQHDEVSKELAAKYKVDWKKSVFCSLTGEISAVPDETQK